MLITFKISVSLMAMKSERTTIIPAKKYASWLSRSLNIKASKKIEKTTTSVKMGNDNPTSLNRKNQLKIIERNKAIETNLRLLFIGS